MATRKLADAIVVSGDDVPLIGRIEFHSIPDTPVNSAELMRAWQAAGLVVDCRPEGRQPVHIFQTACRAQESRRTNGRDVEIKVDEVLHDANECVYQVTRMVRDRGNKLIEHPKALTIAYDKLAGTIEVRELEDYELLAGIEEQIREEFARNADTINGAKVRNGVRRQLERMDAQSLRRNAGGVYFVPVKYRFGTQMFDSEPKLDALRDVLTQFYNGDADFHTLDVAGKEGEREMVRKHFALNVADRTEDVMEKVAQRIRQGRGRGVRQDFMANLYNERRAIEVAIDDFDALVGVEKDKLATHLHTLDAGLVELERLHDEED